MAIEYPKANVSMPPYSGYIGEPFDTEEVPTGLGAVRRTRHVIPKFYYRHGKRHTIPTKTTKHPVSKTAKMSGLVGRTLDGFAEPVPGHLGAEGKPGDWGFPDNTYESWELGEIPASDFQLQSGQNYTFIITLATKPSTSNVQNFINSTPLTQFFDIVNITSPTFSSTYNLTVRMKKTTTYSALINLLRLQLGDMGFGEVDFQSGVVAAPSLVQEITAPVTSVATGVAQTATGLTSNIKWIAIAGLGIFGLFLAMPYIQTFGKKV